MPGGGSSLFLYIPKGGGHHWARFLVSTKGVHVFLSGVLLVATGPPSGRNNERSLSTSRFRAKLCVYFQYITCCLIGTILVEVWIPGTDHIIQYSQKLWCEAIQNGELRDIRILLTFWSCKTKIDSCIPVPGMCSTVLYSNSRNEKKIEESKIFYDIKPFSLDQGYLNSSQLAKMIQWIPYMWQYTMSYG